MDASIGIAEAGVLVAVAVGYHQRGRLGGLTGVRLMHAMRRGQLFLQYQPRVSFETGQALGVEALVRWAHPRRGLIPPSSFIDRLEDSRVVRRLDAYVLAAAITEAKRLELAGVPIPVAVNLSARSLDDPELGPGIDRLLLARGLRPELLQLEITERALEQTPAANAAVSALSSRGITVALDDFGVGYSALQRLVRMPIGALKIDRSFVSEMATNPRAALVVYSAVELAHSLGLHVTAEGVESEELFHQLRALGVDCGQGYVISKPLDPDNLVRWLRPRASLFPERRSGDERRHARAILGTESERRSWVERRAGGRAETPDAQ